MPPFRQQPWGYDWAHGLFALLFFLLVVAALAWVVLTLIRHGDHDHRYGRPGPRSEAQRILEERFARGEIDEEEFTRRRDLLRNAP